MANKLFIPILLGTNRQDRQSEKAAKFLLSEMEKHLEIETRLFDVRDFKFPADDYGPAIKDQFPEWRDAIIKADGLMIVSPEYNHSYPGVLKSVLDLLLEEYGHKPVGLVGVSNGIFGGARMIQSLIPVVRRLGLAPMNIDLTFPQVQNIFDERGNLQDEKVYDRTAVFLSELIWLAKTFKYGRENFPADHIKK